MAPGGPQRPESVKEGNEPVHPDRQEGKGRHQASGPGHEVGEPACLAVCRRPGWQRVPVDGASDGSRGCCSYRCQLSSGKVRWGKRLGTMPGKCPHALWSCAVSRLEGGGLGCVPVLFEIHPATGFRRLSVQPVHLGQSAAKHQVVRKGRHQPAQTLTCDGNPACGQVCVDSGKGVSQRHKSMIRHPRARRRPGFCHSPRSARPAGLRAVTSRPPPVPVPVEKPCAQTHQQGRAEPVHRQPQGGGG